MAQTLEQIEWKEPILPVVGDPEWASRVKAHFGMVPDLFMRLAPSPWLREAALNKDRVPLVELSERQAAIAALVTSQENACRYCYGAARAQMRLFGYPEKLISRIERDVQLAELDERERAFIQFCRNLARSKPRPAAAERDALIGMGYSPRAVAETAFHIAAHCFSNRVATFIATPPLRALEEMPDNLWVRLMRPLVALRLRRLRDLKVEPLSESDGAFGTVVNSLAGLPGAHVLNEALSGAFASPILSQELKLLMFAVVARSLSCTHCEEEAAARLEAAGLSPEEVERGLSALDSPRLSAEEGRILSWVRETVHFETGEIQARTRELVEAVGPTSALEAIGVAALANSTVRLAMLLE